MSKNKHPVRMCIACRKRELQSNLIRLQHIEKGFIPYRGYGRSLYICQECSNNPKRIKSITRRYRLNEEVFVTMLKELNTNG